MGMNQFGGRNPFAIPYFAAMMLLVVTLLWPKEQERSSLSDLPPGVYTLTVEPDGMWRLTN